METQLRFTGVGGQGVLLAGEILAEAKIAAGGFGTKTSTYTSQVRGGPTKVDIILSPDEIIYPYAKEGEIDFMLSVAQSSYQLFKNDVKEGGIVVVDPNLVQPTPEDEAKFQLYKLPIITIAKEEVGNIITQSVVALAVTVVLTGCVDKEQVLNTMVSKVPAKVVELNQKAFAIGEAHALKALAARKIS
ncbi:2-oxoacid:acceptor oxidoreductase family protein [Helicobacter ailurogastricus]|uniref:2-oxoglutarate oxidoreductase, gamma subunit n=1 Tax=Helicobacter ailurogastricus TaxID=1578720 RepID=A0A0K2XDP4_9HELI|nr:2-oxoacid:acceptor oxidoreductase family protein [Helicobacter ailurogastricus]CRF40911.1 2-oxoglutarate oxidoreductase, gamma subunit [Helicobacter ailurogastricus]CRF42819.1 2-oxoglutarate oxidoreductase, gamma subunit [Helicobacter ailurogastricus]CRF44387.1 2-oxoglutarate oxidoreductase, gamma subunit [Helicobacter ailurogastricus]